jgi:hypothetical protein
MSSVARYRRGWGPRKPPPWAQLDRTHPLTRGVAGEWPINEAAGGHVFDKSGHGQMFTAVNGPTWEGGQHGMGLHFHAASNQYLTTPSTALLAPGNASFTWAISVNFASIAANSIIVAKHSGGGAFDYLLWMNSANGYLNFELGSGGNVNCLAHGPVVINKWYYIICWFDAPAATVNIQVDGGPVDSGASGVPVVTATPVSVGAFSTGSANLDGRIGHLAYWSRVLSAPERLQQQARPFARYAAPPPRRLAATATAGGPGPLPSLSAPGRASVVLYAEADMLAGPPATGAAVGSWPNTYGLGNLAGAAGTARPTFQPGDVTNNSKPYLAFARASSQYLETAAAGTITQVYGVMRAPANVWDGYGSLFGSNDSLNRTMRFYFNRTGFLDNPLGVTVNGVAMELDTPDLDAFPLAPIGVWKVVKLEVANPTISRTYRIAGTDGAGGNFCSLHVAALIAVNADLSGPDETLVTNYLKAKYLPAAPAAGTIPTVWNVAGLAHYADASTGAYQDLAGTTPAADGQPVGRWDGQDGNGVSWSQSTTAQKPTYRATGLNGKPCLEFNGAASSPSCMAAGVPAVLETLKGQSYTIILIGRMNRDTGINTILCKTPNTADARIRFSASSGTWVDYNRVGSSQTNPSVPRGNGMFSLVYTFAQSSTDHGTETMYVGGPALPVITGVLPAWTAAAPWYLGTQDFVPTGGNNYNFGGQLARIAIYTGVLSGAQITAILRDAIKTYEAAHIWTEGDSLTAGSGATGTGEWPGRLTAGDTAGAHSWEVNNVAVAGTTITTMTGRAPTTIDPYLVPGAVNIVTLMSGTNDDIGGSQTPAAEYAAFMAYGQARIAAGKAIGAEVRVIPFTAPPWATRTAGQITAWQAFNALLVANAVADGWASGVVDYSADPFIGVATARADHPTYWFDAAHMTNLGYDLLAGTYARPVISTVAAVPLKAGKLPRQKWHPGRPFRMPHRGL